MSRRAFWSEDLAEVLTGPFHRRLCVVLGQDEKSPFFFRRGLLSIRKVFHSYVPCSRTDAGHRSYGGYIRVRGIIAQKPISFTRDSDEESSKTDSLCIL
jgi:hypothetical protein